MAKNGRQKKHYLGEHHNKYIQKNQRTVKNNTK